MIKVGDLISHNQMGIEEGSSLQKGMNFHHNNSYSIILMSVRSDAPYDDKVLEGGRVLIYEGHDVPKNLAPDPKTVDQPMENRSGSLTQNGLFYNAALKYKKGEKPELVKVYEKVLPGAWIYNGFFKLIDVSYDHTDIKNPKSRKVFKFTLELSNDTPKADISQLDHNRMIPSSVKRAVWKRDKGQCVICGRKDNLHFDHIIPFSKGGSSLIIKNVQLLCARHNLEKSDKIQ